MRQIHGERRVVARVSTGSAAARPTRARTAVTLSARSAAAAAFAVAVMAAVAAGFAWAQSSSPDAEPGWTGATHAEDIVAARRALMLELERLMRPLDAHAAGEPRDADALRESAGTISTMLLAVPHLFPPPTNIYDPSAETPRTLAMPEIWQEFGTFYSLSEAAAHAAADTLTSDATGLAPAAERLRDACDGCHDRFMRTYVPPSASDEDLGFDFESVLPSD